MDISFLKISMMNYINHFSMYDYVAYSWLILIFFVLILLATVLSKKSILLSIVMFFLSLCLLLAGPFTIKHYLDVYLRASNAQTTLVKKLNFSDSLIVQGKVKNISKNPFAICFVNISILKVEEGYIANLLNQLKSFKNMSISIDKPIDVNSSESFRVVFDGYTYNEDVNVSIKSECY